MARNAEKAQAMLNRFLRKKAEESGKAPLRERRPYLAALCETLDEAEKWRGQVLKEIGRKVVEIQNKSLGTERTRDLNDEINKLLREKGHWERRILELGGRDHSKTSLAVFDSSEVVRSRGYYYFGAAQDLPGVRDIVEAQKRRREERERLRNQVPSSVLYRRLNRDYYGYNEDEEGKLRELERQAEERIQAELIAEWEKENGKHEGDWEWDEGFETVHECENFDVDKRLDELFLELKKRELMEKLIDEGQER